VIKSFRRKQSNQGYFLLIKSVDPVHKDFNKGFPDGRVCSDMAFVALTITILLIVIYGK